MESFNVACCFRTYSDHAQPWEVRLSAEQPSARDDDVRMQEKGFKSSLSTDMIHQILQDPLVRMQLVCSHVYKYGTCCGICFRCKSGRPSILHWPGCTDGNFTTCHAVSAHLEQGSFGKQTVRVH